MARILIIEDDAPIRANLRRLLGLQGHEVIEAEDGAAGVDTARRRRPDLIVCDVLMPGFDGFAVLSKLRIEPATVHVPFVFLSASAEPDHKRLGLQQGADAYLTKPFQVEQLFAIIDELLARSR